MKRALITAMAVCGLLATAWMTSNGTALAGEVKSLRGDVGIGDTNAAPPPTEVEMTDAVPRTFAQQPPLIPHTTDEYPINTEANTCLECHGDPEMAPIPSPTHFMDRTGKTLDAVSRARYFCTQCHVPQENATELVPNTFKGAQ